MKCFLLTMVFLITTTLSLQDEDDIEFVPTNEWQLVKEGQSIPSGLHVRMDMSTGGKWAKLMDDDSSAKSTAIQHVADQNIDTDSKTSPDDMDQLRLRLEKLVKEETLHAKRKYKYKSDPANPGNEQVQGGDGDDQRRAQEVKNKFRSMEEIRADLEELEVEQESDFSVMSRMLSVAVNHMKLASERLAALADLEFYLHQVDNANDFIKIEGLDKMLTMVTGAGEEESLRREAVHVAGVAMQGNANVQIRGLELGWGDKLLAMLVPEAGESLAVRKKCLFALSCLLRHFPHAQYVFSAKGGFQTLLSLINDQHTDPKLVIKSLQLISDLNRERADASKVAKENEEKIKQYNRFNMTRILVDADWCQTLATLLLSSGDDGVADKTCEAMTAALPLCRDRFNRDDLRQRLKLRLQEVWRLRFQHVDTSSSDIEMSLDHPFFDADQLLRLLSDYDELEEFLHHTSGFGRVDL